MKAAWQWHFLAQEDTEIPHTQKFSLDFSFFSSHNYSGHRLSVFKDTTLLLHKKTIISKVGSTTQGKAFNDWWEWPCCAEEREGMWRKNLWGEGLVSKSSCAGLFLIMFPVPLSPALLPHNPGLDLGERGHNSCFFCSCQVTLWSDAFSSVYSGLLSESSW